VLAAPVWLYWPKVRGDAIGVSLVRAPDPVWLEVDDPEEQQQQDDQPRYAEDPEEQWSHVVPPFWEM
jgi:hypothetical protein